MISNRLARVIFDIAVNSANFGSGFLDDVEVAALRQVAEALGVDPMAATPRNFRCQYHGHHRAEVYLDSPYFSDLEGVPRNAYRLRSEFPPDAKLKGIRGGDDLGNLPAPVLRLYCTECGQRWDALDCPPRLRP